MLTCVVYYHCKPGQREAFHQALTDLGVRAFALSEPGNHGYDYYFAAHDPDLMLLMEYWDSKNLQQQHCQTPLFQKLQEIKPQYVADFSMDEYLS